MILYVSVNAYIVLENDCTMYSAYSNTCSNESDSYTILSNSDHFFRQTLVGFSRPGGVPMCHSDPALLSLPRLLQLSFNTSIVLCIQDQVELVRIMNGQIGFVILTDQGL
jgi:hypothetical protein